MTSAPNVHCPAVHVPSAPSATKEELAPILTWLARGEGPSRTERFPKGTVQRDGRLDFCKQGLGAEGLRSVLASVGTEHPALRHILLGTNGLGDEGATVLGAALHDGLDVATLYLGCNAIRSKGAIAIASGLVDHPTLRALWLKRNPIGEEGLAAILDVLPRTKIRTLDLTNCGLGDALVARLVESLHRQQIPIENLFLGGNGLVDATPLVAWLEDERCPLEHLFLSASRLGNDGATRVLQSARVHGLDLASNGIDDDGIRSFTKSGSLRFLNLGLSPATAKLDERPNVFGDDAVDALLRLAEAPLERLDLTGTNLTSRGARRVVTALSVTTHPPAVVFGKGIARRLRQEGKSLSPKHPAVPSDVRAVASVYR